MIQSKKTDKDNLPCSKLGIGLPIYNGEKYISDAIDSILAQTFTDFELIISDNCSTDATARICQAYVVKDSRIRYIRQSSNIGVNSNFEFVLQQAQGEYFMWVACDDYLENKDYLNVMINKMMEGYDFCFPGVKLHRESLEQSTISDNIMTDFSKCITNFDFCKKTVYTCSYQIYGVYRRSFLNDNFKYIKQCMKLRLFAEGLFVHAISSSSILAYVSSVNLIYRRHATNTSSVQLANHLLVDFLKFTYRLFIFYLTNEKFTFFQKISIFTSISHVHGKYFLFLIYSYVSHTWSEVLKKLNFRS